MVEDGWGGELGDPRQIAVLHELGGVQAAAGENGVLDAGGEHVPKADLQIEVVQLLQQTVLHVIGQIGQAVPVDLVYRPRRQLHDLFPDIPIPGGTIPPFQRVQHGGMSDYLMTIGGNFVCEEEQVPCRLLLSPDLGSLNFLLKKLGVAE